MCVCVCMLTIPDAATVSIVFTSFGSDLGVECKSLQEKNRTLLDKYANDCLLPILSFPLHFSTPDV